MRPKDVPFPALSSIHVSDLEMVRRVVAEWPEAAQKLAEKFWPGPLTLVLPKDLRRPRPGHCRAAYCGRAHAGASYCIGAS